MRSIHLSSACLSLGLFLGCAATPDASVDDAMAPDVAGTVEVVPASEVDWTPLNPARGDQSPRAATLWGDRGADEATGFLVEFVDGFSSPPHIHNVTYRGVVISGLVHNDDPEAAKMWMPPGSFWTQPAGESHITAAKGDHNVAYIEIDAGPYLVQPPGEAYDTGERPVNVDASNIVWLGPQDIAWLSDHDGPDAPEVAFLWGDPRDDDPAGMLIKLPAGFEGAIRSGGKDFRAVVIQGSLEYLHHRAKTETVLDSGSYIGSVDEVWHQVSNKSDKACVLYVRSTGDMTVTERDRKNVNSR